MTAMWRVSAPNTASLLRPGVEIPVGSAFCCGCPWAEFELEDPTRAAVAHHDATGHPTVAKPRADLAEDP
jgi:hypothetical protein